MWLTAYREDVLRGTGWVEYRRCVEMPLRLAMIFTVQTDANTLLAHVTLDDGCNLVLTCAYAAWLGG